MNLKDIFRQTSEEISYNRGYREYNRLVCVDEERSVLVAQTNFFRSLLALLAQNAATKLVPLGASPGQLDVVYTMAEESNVRWSGFFFAIKSVEKQVPSVIVNNYTRDPKGKYIYNCRTRVKDPFPDSGMIARIGDGLDMVNFLVLSHVPTSSEDFAKTISVPPRAGQSYQVFRKGELIVHKGIYESEGELYSLSWPHHYVGGFQQSGMNVPYHIWCCVTDSTRRPEGNNPEDRRVTKGVLENNLAGIV